MKRSSIVRAVRTLNDGGVIAYPTEAVYGLGCDPLNEHALLHLLSVKRRRVDKGLILIAADFHQLQPYLHLLSSDQYQQMMSTWPGPVTWVVPKAPWVSPLLSGGRSTLAVRVSDHPGVRALCRRFGGALVSTSANRASATPTRSGFRTQMALGKELDFILHGQVGGLSRPTEIRDLATGAVLRAGGDA